MKILTANNGKQILKLNKTEWKNIGKAAGWMKKATEYSEDGEPMFEAPDEKSVYSVSFYKQENEKDKLIKEKKFTNKQEADDAKIEWEKQGKNFHTYLRNW